MALSLTPNSFSFTLIDEVGTELEGVQAAAGFVSIYQNPSNTNFSASFTFDGNNQDYWNPDSAFTPALLPATSGTPIPVVDYHISASWQWPAGTGTLDIERFSVDFDFVNALRAGETIDRAGPVRLTDNVTGETADASLAIHIVGANDPPKAIDDEVVVGQGQLGIEVHVLGNDSDPDHDTLLTLTQAQVNDDVVVPKVGKLPLIGATLSYDNDSINIVLNPLLNFLGTGETATFTVSYVIEDDSGVPDSAKIEVTVVGSPDAMFNGTAAADNLIGENDADTINGFAGNDIIYGRKGKDFLTGGPGADKFDFNTLLDSKKGSARDQIKDFKHGQHDRIDLRDIDAEKGGGNQKFKWIGKDDFHDAKGELRYEDKGSKVIVQGDVNGDGKADFEIWVGAGSLAKGDFIL